MRVILAVAFSLLAAGPLRSQSSSDIELEITNFHLVGDFPVVVVEITNNGKQTATGVVINCPFKSKEGKTLSVGIGAIVNLQPGQTKHSSPSGQFGKRAKTVSCYVDRARF